MSQASSQAISGNVTYGEKSNTWVIIGVIGLVALGLVWIFKRK